MQLTIFGASGGAGQQLVAQALADGYPVTVLARNPDKLGQLRERLNVVVGDVRDAGAVAQAVAGSQAVLSVLGPTSNTPEFAVSRGMDHILAAMTAHGVRRLIVSIGAGVRDPLDQPTAVHAFFGGLVKLLSRHAYEDMLRVNDTLRASTGIDWTIVRVPRLTDGPRTGVIKPGYVGKDLGTQLTRADMAAFMLSQLTDLTYVGRAPAISN